MSTDLRTALRDAVSAPPSYDPDVAAIVGAGTRRTRRRARVAVAACAAVVVALAVTAGVVSSPRPDPDPQPAKVVRLDLGGAESVRLDVMATTRAPLTAPGDGPLDRATFEAITDDGLVLVNRHRNASRPLELGLLDPVQRRDGLAAATWGGQPRAPGR